MKERHEEWVLPKMKELNGSKDPNHDVEIVAKYILSLDQVKDGAKKTNFVKSTKDPPTIEVNQT
jgi:hypothetical protein